MRYIMPSILLIMLIAAVPLADPADAEETHTVTFEMPDGTVLSTQQVPHGGYVDLGSIPQPEVPPGATFLGWGDVTQQILSDTVFTASFSYDTTTYTVRYYSEDRVTLMHTEIVEAGKPATYDVIPTKSDSGRYSYEFERWSADLSSVRSDLDVYPIFKATERMCEVRFFDYDRSLICTVKVPYGTTLKDMPEAPTREPTIGYTYEFECWSITPNGNSPASFADITDTKFVYAFYRPTLAVYTVTFVSGDEVLRSVEAEYNTQMDASSVLDLKEGHLAKMYRDPGLSREFPIGFTVIGNTTVYVDLIPGNYQCDRDAEGKVIGNAVNISHDTASISELKGPTYTVCDISQFPNATVAEMDDATLVLLRDSLGDDALVRISVPRGSVTMTAGALYGISDGHGISVSVNNGPSSVKIASALKKIQYSSYYSLSLRSDGRPVTQLPAPATVSFPFQLAEGLNPVAWSVSSKGLLTVLESEYDGREISFAVDAIQYFALGTDTPGSDVERKSLVMPYGEARYEVSGSGSTYGYDDSPQSRLVSIAGDFLGNVLFVPSSFDNRPLTSVSSDAFAGVTDADAIVIPLTVSSFEWTDWSCTVRDVYFMGDRPDFIGSPPSYVVIHSFSDRSGWSASDTEVHDRYTYNGSIGKDPFTFRFVVIQGAACIDRYVSGSYVVVPRTVAADGHEYQMQYIGDAAFMNTDNASLKQVYRLEYGTYGLDTIEVPATVTELLTFAFRGSTVKDVHGCESVVHIGDGAFRNCSRLSPITLHDPLLYIGEDAFLACSSKAFSRMTVPSNVQYIGSSAFYGCSGLTSVSLDCQIKSIPASCFAQCSSLTSISIPETVTEIGDSAFYNCTSILYIDLMNTEAVGSGAFQCSGKGSLLECVVLGQPLTTLGRNSFANCTDLAELEAYCNMPPDMEAAFTGVDLDSIQYYAASDVAASWSQYSVELLDEPEGEPDRTMTYVVIGMIAFFVIAGMLSLKYRMKFERRPRSNRTALRRGAGSAMTETSVGGRTPRTFTMRSLARGPAQPGHLLLHPLDLLPELGGRLIALKEIIGQHRVGVVRGHL